MRTRLVNLRVAADDGAGHGPDTAPAEILIEGEKIAAVTGPGERAAEADEQRIDLGLSLIHI